MTAFVHELRELLPCGQNMGMVPPYNGSIAEPIAQAGMQTIFWKASQQFAGFPTQTDILTAWLDQNLPRNSAGGENDWYNQYFTHSLGGVLEMLSNGDYRNMDTKMVAAFQAGGQLDADGQHTIGDFVSFFDSAFPTLNGRSASEIWWSSPQMYMNGPDGRYLVFGWTYDANWDTIPNYNPFTYMNSSPADSPVINDGFISFTFDVKQRQNGISTLATDATVYVIAKDWTGQTLWS